MQLGRSRLFCTGLLFLSAGCTTLPGVSEHYLACPYDTVWDAALQTMKDRPVTAQEKDKGLIETGWVELGVRERPYGALARDTFENKERARMTLTMKRINDVTQLSLNEERQVWHARGGVTQQATRWWPVEPSEEAVASVLGRIKKKLKDQGCPTA